MSHDFVVAAHSLSRVVEAVAGLAYCDASLTLWCYPGHWEAYVDYSDENEPVGVSGPSLSVVLSHLLEKVAPNVGAWKAGPVTPEADLVEFLRLLASVRGKARSYPIDVAFVPRSKVEPDRPWEVGVDLGRESEPSAGVSALQALKSAIEGSTDAGG